MSLFFPPLWRVLPPIITSKNEPGANSSRTEMVKLCTFRELLAPGYADTAFLRSNQGLHGIGKDRSKPSVMGWTPSGLSLIIRRLWKQKAAFSFWINSVEWPFC